jgi:RNA-directed DNA polymerase
MMNGTKKSDSSIVPAKPANKAERSAAELVEGSDGTKRNAELQSTVRTQSREAVSQAQARIRGAVTRNEKEKLTALLHHISIDVLRWAFFNIKKQAAPGVDRLTWVDYAADLDRNLTDLHARVHSGAYRALPSRRRYIPKADGKQRPLGVAALEDKIVQAAVVAILTPIYEAEFLGFSYGFRPDAASTMRWMRSHTELMHVKSTGFSMPTYRGSSPASIISGYARWWPTGSPTRQFLS